MSDLVDRILDLLKKGDFMSLEGECEDAEFECKAEPYHLASDNKKQELAKDVSALANATGGLILLGAQTRKVGHISVDRVERIRPFKLSLVNSKQYHDVLSEWIAPSIQNLEITPFQLPNSDKGLIAIRVPAQPERLRPFLVTRHVSDVGKRSEAVFGYFERKQDRVDHLTVEQIRAYLNTGLRYDQVILEQVEELKALIRAPRLADSLEREQAHKQHAWRERIEAAVGAVGLSKQPTFMLSAFPESRVEFPTLFAGRDSELFQLLERPPEIRRSGFRLRVGDVPTIVRGELRRTLSPERRILELWADGTLIYVTRGDQDGLCWATEKAGVHFRINVLFLMEQIYLFHVLSRKIMEHGTPIPAQVSYQVDLRTPKGSGLYQLPPTGEPWSLFPDDFHSAPENEFSITCSIDHEAIDAAGAAYILAKKIYNWFELEDDSVPFTERRNDDRVVSVQQIVEQSPERSP